MSEIVYTEEKRFTQAEVEELFLSVGWVSGKYPERLYRALLGSSTVITAWADGRLAGLARALDDGAMPRVSALCPGRAGLSGPRHRGTFD